MYLNINKYSKTISEWRFTPMANYICPVFNITKNESNSPRGLVMLLDLIRSGQRNFDEVIAEKLYQCATCYLCSSLAYDGTDPTGLILAARADIVNAGKVPQSVDKLKNKILKRDKIKKNKLKAYSKKSSIGVFIDPNNIDLFLEEVKSNLAILDKAGVDYSILGQDRGSGAHFFDMGFREIAQKIAEENISKLIDYGIKQLIFLSPYDYRAFSEWYEELGIKEVKQIEYTTFPTYLTQLIRGGKISFKKNKNIKITYHDSTHLIRTKQNIFNMEYIINKNTCFNYLPMNKGRSEASCDGGVLLPELYPDIAYKITQKCLNKAKLTGAEVLLTSCFYSQYNFQKVMKKEEIKLMNLGKFILKFLV